MSDLMQNPAVIATVVALIIGVGAVVAVVRSRSKKRAWSDALSGDLDASSRPLPAPAKAATNKLPPKDESASIFGRLVDGLARTKGRMVGRVDDLFRGKKVVDDELWGQLEELLITSDVGIRATTRLLESMRARAAREELEDPARLRDLLRENVLEVLAGSSGHLLPIPADGPLVIMVVGVNGAGKTTTIGKLAARFTAQGKTVLIAAGDTFRAAAIEQVVVWGKRAGAEVVRHEAGSDPAAVAHDAVKAGVARGADVVICDTAGRLHTKANLMVELQKVHRVIGKVMDGAPQEVLLVLDSTNGQNAIAQAREFANAVGVTAIALTKLDGTARGGVIIGIADELSIPVKLIGIGESVEDLRDFEPAGFVDALFGVESDTLGRGRNSAEAAAEDIERGISVESEMGAPTV
jgi:fused signal recognition particle receptor